MSINVTIPPMHTMCEDTIKSETLIFLYLVSYTTLRPASFLPTITSSAFEVLY